MLHFGMRWSFYLVLVALSGPVLADGRGGYNPPPPREGYVYPDCYCTDSDGRRVEVGERACLRINRREVVAQCFMSQNSPGWRIEEGDGCPSV